MKQQFGSIYSDITITRGEGDTIVYTYTYAQNPTVAIDATKGIVPDVKIQIIYLKPDKSEWCSNKF